MAIHAEHVKIHWKDAHPWVKISRQVDMISNKASKMLVINKAISAFQNLKKGL